jgi:DNA-binding response OmpR family regulator
MNLVCLGAMPLARTALLSPLNILIVGDACDFHHATLDALNRIDYEAKYMAKFVAKWTPWTALENTQVDFHADVLILDIDLLGASELNITRQLLEADPAIGIIMLIARAETADKVAAYEYGVDLLINKPTAPEELAAAVISLARRMRFETTTPLFINLDSNRMQLTSAQASVNVSLREYAVLVAFVNADGHCLDYAQLMSIHGKTNDEFNKSTLGVFMVRLRQKLQLIGAHPPIIKSIRGLGYQLCVPLNIV